MNVPISAGGGTALLNVFKVDVTNFVNQFVVGYFAPVMAAPNEHRLAVTTHQRDAHLFTLKLK